MRTFPESDFYDLEELLTSMGIGEAAVTILDERGVPTPVVHTRLVGPVSSMSPAPDLDALAKASPLFANYGNRQDPESARDKLGARMDAAAKAHEAEEQAEAAEQAAHDAEQAAPRTRTRRAEPSDTGNPVLDVLTSRQGQAIGKEIVRGVFGMLKKRR